MYISNTFIDKKIAANPSPLEASLLLRTLQIATTKDKYKAMCIVLEPAPNEQPDKPDEPLWKIPILPTPKNKKCKKTGDAKRTPQVPCRGLRHKYQGTQKFALEIEGKLYPSNEFVKEILQHYPSLLQHPMARSLTTSVQPKAKTRPCVSHSHPPLETNHHGFPPDKRAPQRVLARVP